MKVIAENLITEITASSENANFPASNLLDNHPKRLWKSDGANQARLTMSIGAGTNCIAIFNTNAQRAVCNISDPNETAWESGTEWEAGTEWASSDIDATTQLITIRDVTAIWIEFEPSTIPLSADITLTNLDETVHAGVAVGGVVQNYDSPGYGLEEGRVNRSVTVEMSNGSFYHHKRDIVRTFSGAVRLWRGDQETTIITDAEQNVLLDGGVPVVDGGSVVYDGETITTTTTGYDGLGFYDFMEMAESASFKPMAWKVTDLSSDEWVVFARFGEMPVGSHILPTWSEVSLSLIEVL